MYPARSYRFKPLKCLLYSTLFSYCEDTTEIAQQGVLTLKSIFYHTLEKEKKNDSSKTEKPCSILASSKSNECLIPLGLYGGISFSYLCHLTTSQIKPFVFRLKCDVEFKRFQ